MTHSQTDFFLLYTFHPKKPSPRLKIEDFPIQLKEKESVLLAPLKIEKYSLIYSMASFTTTWNFYNIKVNLKDLSSNEVDHFGVENIVHIFEHEGVKVIVPWANFVSAVYDDSKHLTFEEFNRVSNQSCKNKWGRTHRLAAKVGETLFLMQTYKDLWTIPLNCFTNPGFEDVGTRKPFVEHVVDFCVRNSEVIILKSDGMILVKDKWRSDILQSIPKMTWSCMVMAGKRLLVAGVTFEADGLLVLLSQNNRSIKSIIKLHLTENGYGKWIQGKMVNNTEVWYLETLSLGGGHRAIIAGERDGYMHLLLCSPTGKLSMISSGHKLTLNDEIETHPHPPFLDKRQYQVLVSLTPLKTKREYLATGWCWQKKITIKV